MQKICENCGQVFELRFKGKYRNSLPSASFMKKNRLCPNCRKKHAKNKNKKKNKT